MVRIKCSEKTRQEYIDKTGHEPPDGVEVVTPEEAETADAVVCMRTNATTKRYFEDDVYTHCHYCKEEIYHRPTVPVKPIKVCLDCAVKRLRQEAGLEE